MANSITIMAVFAAMFKRAQEATVLLPTYHRLLRPEQQSPHPGWSTECANHFRCLDRGHQRVDGHPVCEDNEAKDHCGTNVGSLTYQSIIQPLDVTLVRLEVSSRKDNVLVLGPLGAGTSLVFIHPPCAFVLLWQKAGFELAPRGLTSIIGPGTFMNLPISSFEPEGRMVVLLMCPSSSFPRSFPRSYGRPTSLAYGGCACNVCILAPLNAPKYTGGSMGTYAPCGAASGPPEANRARRYGKSEVLRGY